MMDRKGGFASAVVGASGFGGVHVRELIKAGATSLRVVGRNAESTAATARKLATLHGTTSIVASTLEELVAEPADFVSICSPTEMHADHAAALLPAGSYIFVEKPFIWQSLATADDILTRSQRLLDLANGRLTVNQPTARLMEAILAVGLAKSRPRSFSMRSQTRGNYVGTDIAVDLLPHALSAILVLLGEAGAGLSIQDLSVVGGDNSWRAEFSLGALAVSLDFLQDPGAPGSELSFKIDGRPVRRGQREIQGGFEVFLESSGEIHVIENPISVSIARAVDVCRAGGLYQDAVAIHSVVRLMCQILKS